MRMRPLLATAVLLLAAAAPAAAQATGADAAAQIKTGKELFEKHCRLCHGLERSLATTRDAAEWGQTVKRMVSYGTPLGVAQRPQVVRYLAARSVFATRCGACHEPTRVVGDAPGPRDWKALAERMSAHARELQSQGKAPADSAFSPEEQEEIVGLLQAILPGD